MFYKKMRYTLDPIFHFVERRFVCDVEHQDGGHSTAVVHGSKRAKPFLPSSIPKLKFDLERVNRTTSKKNVTQMRKRWGKESRLLYIRLVKKEAPMVGGSLLENDSWTYRTAMEVLPTPIYENEMKAQNFKGKKK